MKKIPKPELKSATVMSAFDMNKVPFSKTRTVLTPEQLDKIANGQSIADSSETSSLSDPIPKIGGSDPVPKMSSGASNPVTKLGGADSVTKIVGSDPVTKLGSSSASQVKK